MKWIYVVAKIYLVVGSIGIWGACSTGSIQNSVPEKEELLRGKSDGVDVCARYGFPPGCDICEEFGWYEDQDCDWKLIAAGVCKGPDPACGNEYIPTENSCVGDGGCFADDSNDPEWSSLSEYAVDGGVFENHNDSSIHYEWGWWGEWMNSGDDQICEEGAENTEERCSDGCSNDGDLYIDCDDYDCACTLVCGGNGC